MSKYLQSSTDVQINEISDNLQMELIKPFKTINEQSIFGDGNIETLPDPTGHLGQFLKVGSTGAMWVDLLNLIFPVGCIMIKDTDANYSGWLGFTWQKVFAGRVLVGQDTTQNEFDTIGETGGSKTHNHLLPVGSYQNGDNVAVTNQFGVEPNVTTSSYTRYTNASYVDTRENIRLHYSETKSNLQPYQVVAYWKRIS